MQGLNELVVASMHMRRKSRNGRDPLPWKKIMDGLIESNVPVGELHVEVGRADYEQYGDPETAKISADEYRALLNGPEALGRTQLGDIITQTVEIHATQAAKGEQKLPLLCVLELPAQGLAKFGLVSMKHYIAAHKQALGSLDEFMQSLGASPK